MIVLEATTVKDPVQTTFTIVKRDCQEEKWQQQPVQWERQRTNTQCNIRQEECDQECSQKTTTTATTTAVDTRVSYRVTPRLLAVKYIARKSRAEESVNTDDDSRHSPLFYLPSKTPESWTTTSSPRFLRQETQVSMRRLFVFLCNSCVKQLSSRRRESMSWMCVTLTSIPWLPFIVTIDDE